MTDNKVKLGFTFFAIRMDAIRYKINDKTLGNLAGNSDFPKRKQDNYMKMEFKTWLFAEFTVEPIEKLSSVSNETTSSYVKDKQ